LTLLGDDGINVYKSFLKRDYEKKLLRALKNKSNSILFKAYDYFDKTWLDIGFCEYNSKFDLVLTVKRKLKICFRSIKT
ncbi:hypothetical protein LCGC14_2751740, partial [marine sediment metagenome]